jgi:hypothetical protein
MLSQLEKFKVDGYCIIQNAISSEVIDKLIHEVEPLSSELSNYGVRNLLRKVPYVKEFLSSYSIRRIIDPIIGKEANPVRAIFFDKIPNANWNVAWHQDTTIAVDKKIELEGYGPWSEKEGVVHVEPPESILGGMLTVRIHLDSTDSDNGVLRVIPGSHLKGRIKSSEILPLVESSTIVECISKPGDILIMNPLLLHSSRKSLNPTHRRIIHVEFSSSTLPSKIQWHEKG